MPTINDLFSSTLTDLGFDGTINDQIFDYFGSLGYTGTIDDRWKAWLSALGFSNLKEYLLSKGYTGSVPDMLKASLTAGDFLEVLPALHALTYNTATGEATGVLRGTGSLTTTHAYTIYQPDHEGVYRPFAANEPVVRGGRVVKNDQIRSGDFSVAPWSANSSGTGSAPTLIDASAGTYTTPYGETITLQRWRFTPGPAGSRSQLDTSPSPKTIGDLFVGSVYLAMYDGISRQMQIRTGTWGDVSPVITGTVQRFSVPAPSPFPATGNYSNFNIWATGNLTPNVIFDVLIGGAQFEFTNGRTDTTTPSEYVPTTTAAAQKVFWYENGNSVASNVVTEAVGAAISPEPYYWFQPAATNAFSYSNDQTNIAWSKTASAAQDQVGLWGVANTACTLTDSDGAGYSNVARAFPSSTTDGTDTARLFVLKDSDTSRFPMVRLSRAGGTGKSADAWLNTSTGATTVNGSDPTNMVSSVVDVGLWWEWTISHTDTGTNTGLSILIYPAAGTVFGTTSISATGSIIVGNIEAFTAKTIAQVRGVGPIFTTIAAVSTDYTQYNFDADNVGWTTDGAWYVETLSTVGWQSVELAESWINTMSTGIQVPIRRAYHSVSKGYVASQDLTPTNANAPTGLTGAEYKSAVVFSVTENKRKVATAGSWGTEVAHAGWRASAPKLQIGWSTDQAFGIRNVRRYEASYDAAITIAEDLMA